MFLNLDLKTFLFITDSTESNVALSAESGKFNK